MNEKNFTPSEEDQQWLKELFDSASAEPEAEAPIASSSEDEQWLNELFASTEQAAELSFAPEEPEEPPLVEDLDLTQWPEDLFEAPMPETEIGPDEQAVAAAGLVHPEDAALEEILREVRNMEDLTEQEALTEPAEFNEPEAYPMLSEENIPQPPEETAEPAEAEPQAVYSEEVSDEEEDFFEENAPSKRRPKKKGTYGLFSIPHILVTGVWLAIILTFGVFLGQWLWTGASDVLAFGREEKLVTITVTANDDLDSLTEKLHAAGLIHEPMWFRLYGQITDAMEDIAPGTFELNTLFDYHALVAHMSTYSAARVTVKVVIPEGYSCAQTFALLEEKGVCSVADLENASIAGDLNEYWFLEGIVRDHKYCLEGYLFPDTYVFYVGDNASRVLNKLLSNFDTRFTDIMAEKLDILNETVAEMMRANGLSESYIEEHRFTIREVVIIASMIEKETSGAAESYTISSVIYNRLTNPANYPYLNIDAALVYITGSNTITEADKLLDSPYNTYLYAGLIPGPICNPSRVSLDAALDPSSTDYYFYALNPATNEHHFSKTLQEHQAFLDSLPKGEGEEETP